MASDEIIWLKSNKENLLSSGSKRTRPAINTASLNFPEDTIKVQYVSSKQQVMSSRKVRWNESKELNIGMLRVAQYRAISGLTFSHPLLQTRAQFDRRNSSLPQRICALTKDVLNDRATIIDELGSVLQTRQPLDEAVRRFIKVDRHLGTSNQLRERILLNRDLSKGQETFPVRVYSDVMTDHLKPMPSDFQYITNNAYPEGFNKQNELFYSCKCLEACGPNCPCLIADRNLNPNCVYDPLSRCFVSSGDVSSLYQDAFFKSARVLCGPRCSFPPGCSIKYPLASSSQFEIYKDNIKMGFGLRVLNTVTAGEFITEFTGELQIEPSSDTDTDMKIFLDYAFELSSTKFASENEEYGYLMRRCAETFPKLKSDILKYQPSTAYLMPYQKGNIAKFVSHSCYPNATVVRALVNDVRPEHYKLMIVATHDIPAGSEVSIDYGRNYEKRIHCLCKSPLCRSQEQLQDLATLMEHLSKVLVQRALNISVFCARQMEQFADFELQSALARRNMKFSDLTVDDHDLSKQVKMLIKEMTRKRKTIIQSGRLFTSDNIGREVRAQNWHKILSTSELVLLDKNVAGYLSHVNEHFLPNWTHPEHEHLRELIGRLIQRFRKRSSSPGMDIQIVTIDEEPAPIEQACQQPIQMVQQQVLLPSSSIRLNIKRKSVPSASKRVFGYNIQNMPTKAHIGITPLDTASGSFQDKMKGFRIPKKRGVPSDCPRNIE